jgi:NAD(P) transhydrogenase subunit alpha
MTDQTEQGDEQAARPARTTPVVTGVLAESRAGERRVAVLPDAVAALTKAGHRVLVQSGAGRHAYLGDDDYRAAGAEIRAGDDEILADARLLLTVAPLDVARAALLAPGTVLVGYLGPGVEVDLISTLRTRSATGFALELVPRISRAQSMDVLSSQALVAGYRAALVAADRLPRFFPLFMTAAGTVPPAKVLVLGAGVAGLQAIATARRLGAVVEAYDVRAAAADEVRSLGASFVELELDTQEGSGGYAREQSEDFLRRQRELIGAHVAAADAVITTAAIPGRPAPRLVTADMVAAMRPGSVVVDLAAESGGNCELSRPGEEFRHGDVLVWGGAAVPSQLPVHASKLYSANVSAFLGVLLDADGVPRTADDAVADDEILTATRVVSGGTVWHQPTAALLAPPGGARDTTGATFGTTATTAHQDSEQAHT